MTVTGVPVIPGLTAKSADGASAFSYPLIFLPFISSAFVPTASMPGPVRAFAEREILPHVDEWEQAGELPRDLSRKAAAAGLLGVGFPEDVGGEGGDAVDVAIVGVALGAIDVCEASWLLSTSHRTPNPAMIASAMIPIHIS